MNIQTFDFSVNILRSLLWRNNEAVNIQSLMELKQAYFDENNVDFWTDWVNDVFNLKTANSFGLNVWSIILGIQITIDPETEVANSNFGFGEFRKNFNNGNFSSAEDEIILSVEEARLVLRLRYYQLTTNGNVTAINEILEDIFGAQGGAYVEDNLDMTMRYVFNFSISSAVNFVLETFDILPRPAGVEATFSIEPFNDSWGFGSFRKNFNNGNFTGL